MGMNLKQNDGDEIGPVAEINVTPLVDVMLVLLIIFMVSMPAMMSQLSIEIPKKSLSPPPNVKPKPTMYVLVDDVGNYYFQFGFDGVLEQVPFEQLPAKLIEKAADYSAELVYVKAAPRIDYGRVVSLIETMGKTGYNKVALDKNENAVQMDSPAATGAAPAG